LSREDDISNANARSSRDWRATATTRVQSVAHLAVFEESLRLHVEDYDRLKGELEKASEFKRK